MENRWQSLTELTNEYELDNLDNDYLAILGKLKEKRSEIHPDKNGGNFQSNEQKENYHKLDDAVDYVEKQIEQSQQLIPLSQLPKIIDSIVSATAKQNKTSAIEFYRNLKSDLSSELSRKYIVPKFSSGVFAGITSFLFTQAGSLTGHPFLGWFFEGRFGLTILAVMFVISSCFFIITWAKERKEEALSNHLMSDRTLYHIFHLIRENSICDDVVRTDEIRSAICKEVRKRGKLSGITISIWSMSMLDVFLCRPRISHEFIDRVLELHLSKLVEKNLVVEVGTLGIGIAEAYKVSMPNQSLNPTA